MTIKKSFIIHTDSLSVLKKLKDEQAGKLFKAIALFQEDGLLPEDDFISIVFEPFLNQFSRDLKKYQNIVDRNKLNGSKGGRPKNPVGYLETQSNPEEPRKADSGNANVSVSVSKNDSGNVDEECKLKSKSESKRFIAPTLEEVKNYCKERNNSVNPQKFFDYYSAGNWKDAKGNSVKNWKQKLLTWESKDPSPTQKDSLAAKLNSIAGGDYFKSITLGDKAILNCNVGMKTKLYSLPEEIRQKIKDEFKQPIEIN
ncbi:MAG: hypothetical protein RI930_248 [Pseudomonadota bacterium]|jgi:hypothetical protein